MKLKIAILDDDNKVLSLLVSILETYNMVKNVDLHIDTFLDGNALLEKFKRPGDYNILLLDIEMPTLNGIEVAKFIRSTRDRNVLIVFITNYPKYMYDSFCVHPYHFLQKPITKNQIYELFDEIVKNIVENHNLYTIIDTMEKEETINIKDIIYIESTNSKKEELCFHFHDRKLATKGIITTWEKELSEYNFFICHRGFLVNLIHIHYFEGNMITLDNNEKIPISRNMKKKIRDLYLNRVFISKNT